MFSIIARESTYISHCCHHNTMQGYSQKYCNIIVLPRSPLKFLFDTVLERVWFVTEHYVCADPA